MAKILYGVAGEGSGHSSRARVIINHLESVGHEVKVISYDRGYRNLKDDFDVTRIFGLGLDYADNRVRYLPTIFKNIIKTPEAVMSVDRVRRLVERFHPDIVFSDFEPISCIVANMLELPLVSIDNQHRFTNTKIDYPAKYRDSAIFTKAVVNLMIFNSKACLVLSFSDDPITNKKTFLFPPVLRPEILAVRPAVADHILVYLTSEFKQMTRVLRNIRQKFIIYGLGENKTDSNLVFKKASQEEFIRDLASCKGIVANAGFTLITEALHLGKPYLAIPLRNQFEQIYNAYTLEKLAYGKHWDEIDREKIEAFLFNLEEYRSKLVSYPKHDNSLILGKVDDLINKYSKK